MSSLGNPSAVNPICMVLKWIKPAMIGHHIDLLDELLSINLFSRNYANIIQPYCTICLSSLGGVLSRCDHRGLSVHVPRYATTSHLCYHSYTPVQHLVPCLVIQTVFDQHYVFIGSFYLYLIILL